MKLKTIKIGNKKYLILKSIINNDIEYVLLQNINDVGDYFINKIIKKDNQEVLVNLTEEEFNLINKKIQEQL